MSALAPTILLTGFDPFGGDARNPSLDAVTILAGRWHGDARLVTAELPTEFVAGPHRVRLLVAEHRPDIVIATGVAADRHDITVETLGRNWCDARIPDNSGWAPAGMPIDEHAEEHYSATLPTMAIVNNIRAAGFPASASEDAGSYVCNATLFALARDHRDNARISVGFIHVPRPRTDLTLDDFATALEIAIRTTIDARFGERPARAERPA